MASGARATAPPDPMRGTRRALRGMLLVQVGLALALAAAEIGRALPPGGWPGGLPFAPPGARPPGLEAPVAPGDQRRRFAPSDLPDLPAAGDMPSRLLFEQEGDLARAIGAIAPGDGARFAEWLAGREEPPVTLALHSTGGSVPDALAIGRAVRAAGLATEVAAERLCLSACPYILAGGVARRVGEGAAVGVHQHYHGENSYLPAFMAVEDIQRGQAEVMAHLSDMGVDPRVMIPALSTPPAEIYVLLPEELVRHGLVTPDGT